MSHAKPIVLIPSYNPGPKVYDTVRAARAQWTPVWVVVDGSTDGSGERLEAMAETDPGLRVIRLPENQGKGAAVLAGITLAQAEGYTHALTMDSDGQHPADLIPQFMAAAQAQPECMVLGVPVFDADAPALRVKGRRVSNWWANLETLWMGIGDSLYGFRVYPIAPLRRVMAGQTWMRRFDFDTEAGDDATRSFHTGVLHTVHNPDRLEVEEDLGDALGRDIVYTRNGYRTVDDPAGVAIVIRELERAGECPCLRDLQRVIEPSTLPVKHPARLRGTGCGSPYGDRFGKRRSRGARQGREDTDRKQRIPQEETHQGEDEDGDDQADPQRGGEGRGPPHQEVPDAVAEGDRHGQATSLSPPAIVVRAAGRPSSVR